MNCREFGETQLASLAGDATVRARRAAEAHARECAACRRIAQRDRQLDAILTSARKPPLAGLASASRALSRALDPHRAYCARVEAPFGPVYLARTAQGLCRVSITERSEDRFLEGLERQELLADFDPPKLANEVRQLERYFAGRRTGFDLPVDLRLATPFQRRVLRATARVPFGHLASYSEIAGRIGQPGARRAVGGALGRNPVPIVIPCHRIVAGGGGIGGYMGGLDIKRTLMEIEGIESRNL